jgi:hypothetical protein
MTSIPFQNINWDLIEKVEYPGTFGTSYWQTLQFGDIRLRTVTYTAGYLADHWCSKGHIVHCLKGSFISELDSGEKIELIKGQSYIVSDEASNHRSFSEKGAVLLIIDGSFLNM